MVDKELRKETARERKREIESEREQEEVCELILVQCKNSLDEYSLKNPARPNRRHQNDEIVEASSQRKGAQLKKHRI